LHQLAKPIRGSPVTDILGFLDDAPVAVDLNITDVNESAIQYDHGKPT